MQFLLQLFPDMHYLIAESGALVWDLRQQKALSTVSIERQDLILLKKSIIGRDVMPVAFLNGECLMNHSQMELLSVYEMAPYAPTLPKVSTIVEDVLETVIQKGGAEKVNLFHRSAAERDVSRRILHDLGCTLPLIDAEISSLECSPAGVSKGYGLKQIEECIGIPVSHMLMVGDADNDLEAMRTAGYAAAMGNANETVKSMADLVVADNNHNGCARLLASFLGL